MPGAETQGYPFSLLEKYAQYAGSRKKREAVAKVRLAKPRPVTGKNDQSLLSDLINECIVAEEGHRSERDFHVCCVAVERGWAKEDIWKQVGDVGKFAERGEGYFDQTWIKAEGHTREKIYDNKVAEYDRRRLKEEAKKAGKEKEHDTALQQAILDAVQLDVIGRCGNGAIKVFSRSSKRVDTIQNIDQYGYSMFCGLAGTPFRLHTVRAHEGEQVAGIYDLRTVQEAVGEMSHGLGDPGKGKGMGCWSCNGSEDGLSIAIVGARQASEWNGKSLTRKDHPLFRDIFLDFESAEFTQWYSHEKLNEEIAKCKDPNYRRKSFEKLLGLLKRWNWSHRSMPVAAAGVIVATWLQTLWDWRPQVLVGGETNSGKTTLFRLLNDFFGDLALLSSQSSAAGLRQSLETTARVALCDEFDVHTHAAKEEQTKILKMVRDSGRGNVTMRGTASQKAQKFILRHIFWMAGTNVEFEDSTDKNRFIIFELEPAVAGMENQLRIPTRKESLELGMQTFAAILSVAFRAIELADTLVRTTPEVSRAHSRQIESYSVPAACVAAILGDGDDAARKLLQRLMGPVSEDKEHQITKDHDKLLEDLITAQIPLREAGKKAVGQWILDAWKNHNDEAVDVLSRHGIKFDYMTAEDAKGIESAEEGDKCLAIHSRRVRESVLSATQWGPNGFKHALKGLKQWTTKRRKRIGGCNLGADIIDFRKIEQYLADDEDPLSP